MDRCDLSPAKRIAIGPSQNQRPTKCSSVDLVDTDSSTSSLSTDGLGEDESLVSLLRSVPQKEASPNLRRFTLYPTLVEVYASLSNGDPLPARTAEMLEDRSTKRRVYQTLFEVMLHLSVIEEMLIESSFYSRNFDLHSHNHLVLVMAYEFQKERFNLKLPRDDLDKIAPEVVKVGEALWHHKVKLSATLARIRVKGNAQSITELIPNSDVRERYQNSLKEPCYARVNKHKVENPKEEVISVLQSLGYTKVTTWEQLLQQKKSVKQLRRDLLQFSSDCRGTLDCIDLVKDGYIILQDFESYTFVEELRGHLETITGDIILTHCNAGVEAVHIASILGDRGTVFTFGAEKRLFRFLKEKTVTLGVNNLQIICRPFSLTSPDEDHLGRVKMVVCLPPASPVCVSNPVDFVLQEEDLYLSSILQESQRVPPIVQDASSHHTNEQLECLQHALTFTQADQIVYATRSNQECENGAIVRRALDQHSVSSETKLPLFHHKLRTTQPREEESHYYVALLETKMSLQKSADLTASRSEVENIGEDKQTQDTDNQSPVTFVGVEETGPSPNEVIKEAIAKGILDGRGISSQSHSAKLKKKPSKTKRVFSRYDGIPMTISAQRKVVKKKEQTSPKRVFR